MTSARRELVVGGVHAVRRSAWWWGLGIVALAAMTAGFWPSLEGSDALASFDDMKALLEAFGAQNLATPAGYLDGQMYALLLPLLLSGMAVANVSALTSGDEDSGRLEFLHALPVSRRAIWVGRWCSSIIVLGAVTVITATVMVASRPVFSLEEVAAMRLIVATFGCALLAAFHGAVSYAAGGLGARRGTAVGAAVLVLVTGYVMAFLAPLVDGLRGVRSWSPWYWALGTQPVSNGVAGRWLPVIGAAIVALIWLGTRGVERRDIRSA